MGKNALLIFGLNLIGGLLTAFAAVCEISYVILWCRLESNFAFLECVFGELSAFAVAYDISYRIFSWRSVIFPFSEH